MARPVLRGEEEEEEADFTIAQFGGRHRGSKDRCVPIIWMTEADP